MSGNDLPTTELLLWTVPDIFPAIQHGDIHIWRLIPADVARGMHELELLLSPEEKNRASRFRFEVHRQQYVQARGMLRLLLGHYLLRTAQEIELTTGPFGKPALTTGELAFNVSHCQGVTLLAFGPDTLIGVDVEQVRAGSDLLDIASSHFSVNEYQKLLSVPRDDAAATFFRCWTRKEAFLKAEGTGLSRALDGFEVTLLPEEAAALITCAWDSEAASHWTLHHLAPLPGYAGAIAFGKQADQGPRQVRCWSCSHEILP